MVAPLAAACVENHSEVVMSAAPKSVKGVTGARRYGTRNYGTACSVGQPQQKQWLAASPR